ncbi:MAG: hypothetical protein ACT4NL_08885 [Pseudomarimonas sp.]
MASQACNRMRGGGHLTGESNEDQNLMRAVRFETFASGQLRFPE